MPEIIETTVYRLDKLSEHARTEARAWYRERASDHDWYGFVYDDFEHVCEITQDAHRPPLWRRHAIETVHLVLRLLEPGRRRLL